jgi:hypothetical protein
VIGICVFLFSFSFADAGSGPEKWALMGQANARLITSSRIKPFKRKTGNSQQATLYL